jgi:hypothetical protein
MAPFKAGAQALSGINISLRKWRELKGVDGFSNLARRENEGPICGANWALSLYLSLCDQSFKGMAESEGFEPPIALRLCLISSQVHSTGLCQLSSFLYLSRFPTLTKALQTAIETAVFPHP